MIKEVFRIGIIDDDPSKVTQIMTKLDEGFTNAKPEKATKYSKYQFETFELELKTEIYEVIMQVVELRLDCVLIDYKLSSYNTIVYSGIELAKNIMDYLYEFPIFILTSHEDDLFNNEVFNSYQVFDFSRYLDEEQERIELNFKIIEQILKYRHQLESWEDEIKKLLPLSGENAEIDERILELDSYLEKSLNGRNRIPESLKKALNSDKVSELLSKIDILLESE